MKVEAHETPLTSRNALEIIGTYDIVVDGTDNFQTRYLVNDACVLLGKPNVYGSIFRFEGQASVFATADAPCYRCLFREPPPPGLVPSCAEGGVLGVLPGHHRDDPDHRGAQAHPRDRRDVSRDDCCSSTRLRMRFRTLNLRKDPACPACGTHEITELIDYEEFCGVRQAAADDAAAQSAVPEITPVQLAARIARGDDFDLIDVREPHEWDIARIPGARLIPLGTLVNELSTLDSARDIVVHCKMGGRSAKAVQQLQASGFRKVWNLAGGITRWSDDVDPSTPKY